MASYSFLLLGLFSKSAFNKLAAVVGVSRAQYCPDQTFLACTAGLAEFWKTDPGGIWTTPSQFAEAVNAHFVQPYSLQNLVNVCNGLASFYKCFGRQFLYVCMGPLGWVQRGREPSVAYTFDGMLSSLQFQCGPGLASLWRADDVTACLQRTTINYDSEIQDFYRSFELNVTHDRNNACAYGQILVNGISSIYSSGPCRAYSNHANWFACEMTRNYVFSQFRHCQHEISCPKSVSAEAPDFSAIIRNGDSEHVDFLLPAHWDKHLRTPE